MCLWPNIKNRFAAFILTIPFILFQTACSTSAPPRSGAPSLNTNIELNNQKIALIPARFPAESNLAYSSSSKGAILESTYGAGGGALYGTSSALGICAANPVLCPGAIILIPVFAVSGAIVGATHGVVTGTSQEEIDQDKKYLGESVQAFVLQKALTEKLADTTQSSYGVRFVLFPAVGPEKIDDKPDYKHLLRESGLKFALETAVQKVQLRKHKTGFYLDVDATIRLMSLEEGSELLFRTVSSTAYLETLEGETLAQNLEWSLKSLSNEISRIVFSNVEFPMTFAQKTFGRGVSRGAFDNCCWVCPTSPKIKLGIKFGERRWYQKYPEVSSVSPELQWKEFPTSGYGELFESSTGRTITGVTYNIRVWESGGGLGDNYIYERSGLVEPYHRIEDQLAPDTSYYWSVKACLEMDRDYVACTPWSYASTPWGPNLCELGRIPNSHAYRFKTPASASEDGNQFSVGENPQGGEKIHEDLNADDALIEEAFDRCVSINNAERKCDREELRKEIGKKRENERKTREDLNADDELIEEAFDSCVSINNAERKCDREELRKEIEKKKGEERKTREDLKGDEALIQEAFDSCVSINNAERKCDREELRKELEKKKID